VQLTALSQILRAEEAVCAGTLANGSVDGVNGLAQWLRIGYVVFPSQPRRRHGSLKHRTPVEIAQRGSGVG
jgi:hypothetical protein